jgi:hypothetical protein
LNTITIDVLAVNDAPTGIITAAPVIAINTGASIPVAANVTDIDNEPRNTSPLPSIKRGLW